MNPSNQGFIALMGVLIAGALGVAAILAIIQLGTEYTQVALSYQNEQRAKAYAHSCAEEGLARIRALLTYTGTVNMNHQYGSCSALVINTGGVARTIDSSGSVGTIVKRVKVLVSALNPQITVSSWQEVSAF